LSNFKKGQKSEKIKIQSKFDKVTEEVKFLSAKEKKASDFSISFLIDEQSKIEDKIILNFLLSFLTESESSILKKNVINSKLVDYFGGYLEDGFNQYYLNFYFSGIESADGEKIEKIFYDSLSEISEKGIDREVLKSLLESFEYEQALKKYNSEKGLSLIDSINKYNNYGYSYEHLFFQKENLEILKNLLQKKDKTLENYIDRFILKNDSKVTLTLKATKVFDPYKKITEKLQKINSDKNSKEFKEIEKEIENFKEYENSITESKSVILPPKRSQIPREAIKNKFQKKIIENDDNKIKYFYSQIPEKNIKKVSLYFDAMAVSEDDLQKYRLLSKLLPHFTTKDKTREENEKEVNNIFGQFTISNIFGKNIETLNIYSKLVFKIGFLLEKEEKVLLYLNNFLKNIDFNKDIILEKLDLWAKEMRSSIAKNGSAFAMQNAKAKIDTIHTIGERISGIEFLIFIENLKKEITEDSAKMEQLICDFKNIFKKITLENDLQIAITANDSDFEFHKKINLEKNNEIEKHSYHFKNEGNNEAIIVNSLTNSFNMVAIPILENDKEILKFIALGNFLTFGFI
jgi:Zn-dependent M16 (insulinase) family peptidase